MTPALSGYYYAEIAVWIIICITCLTLLILQLMFINAKVKSIREINKVLLSSTFVHFSFFMLSAMALFNHIYPSPICICKYVTSHFVTLFYCIGKWSMWWFFVCRAELAQGILPILPEIVFKKLIPFNLISSFIFVLSCNIIFMELECPNTQPNVSVIDTYCLWTDFPYWLIICGVLFEMSNSIGYSFLFFYPLYKVHKGVEIDYEAHNITHSLFKKQLIWNGSFTVVATLSTLIFAISLFLKLLSLWWIFEGLDILLNSICCFFMVKQNISFVRKKFCGYKKVHDMID
eukprot:307069_1